MKDINNIPSNNESKFDEPEDKKIIDLISTDKKKAKKNDDDENLLKMLNYDPQEDEYTDEVKQLKNAANDLKKIIKEKDAILTELLEQVKEIIKDLSWSVKNNKIVMKILNILGYSSEEIKKVTESKKGFNIDFILELKK